MLSGGKTRYIGVKLWGTFWMQPQCAQWEHWSYILEHILNVFNMWSLGTLWTLGVWNHNVLCMFSPGTEAFAPSVRYSSLLFQLVGKLTAKIEGSSRGQDRHTRATPLGYVPRSPLLVGGSNVLEEGEPQQCPLPVTNSNLNDSHLMHLSRNSWHKESLTITQVKTYKQSLFKATRT